MGYVRAAKKATMLLLAGSVSACDGCLELEPAQVSGGQYRRLAASEGGGELVLAALDVVSSELVVARLDGSLCRVGAAADYQPLPHPGFDPSWALFVSWSPREGGEGTATVSFSDLHCGALPARIESVVPPVRAWPLEDGWVHVYDAELSHFVARPASGEVARVSQPRSRAIPAGGERIWVHEDERLILRRFDGSEVREIATGVTELTTLYTSFGADALTWVVAWADGSGAYMLDGPDDREPTLLASDACAMRSLWVLGGLAMGYLSPCDAGHLVVRNATTGEEAPIASGVSAFTGSDDTVLYVTGETPGESLGDLHFAIPGAAPVAVASQVDLWRLRTGYRTTDGELEPYHLVLADWTGASGTLMHVTRSGSPTAWREGVSEVRTGVYDVAFLADVAGGLGSLYLRSEDGGDDVLLGHGVPSGAFQFGAQLAAIGFIRDTTPEGGHLTLRALDGDTEGEVDVGVTEFLEVVSEARPGIAYLIAGGPRAGMWFAEP
jgi:hypothetical protein